MDILRRYLERTPSNGPLLIYGPNAEYMLRSMAEARQMNIRLLCDLNEVGASGDTHHAQQLCNTTSKLKGRLTEADPQRRRPLCYIAAGDHSPRWLLQGVVSAVRAQAIPVCIVTENVDEPAAAYLVNTFPHMAVLHARVHQGGKAVALRLAHDLVEEVMSYRRAGSDQAVAWSDDMAFQLLQTHTLPSAAIARVTPMQAAGLRDIDVSFQQRWWRLRAFLMNKKRCAAFATHLRRERLCRSRWCGSSQGNGQWHDCHDVLLGAATARFTVWRKDDAHRTKTPNNMSSLHTAPKLRWAVSCWKKHDAACDVLTHGDSVALFRAGVDATLYDRRALDLASRYSEEVSQCNALARYQGEHSEVARAYDRALALGIWCSTFGQRTPRIYARQKDVPPIASPECTLPPSDDCDDETPNAKSLARLSFRESVMGTPCKRMKPH